MPYDQPFLPDAADRTERALALPATHPQLYAQEPYQAEITVCGPFQCCGSYHGSGAGHLVDCTETGRFRFLLPGRDPWGLGHRVALPLPLRGTAIQNYESAGALCLSYREIFDFARFPCGGSRGRFKIKCGTGTFSGAHGEGTLTSTGYVDLKRLRFELTINYTGTIFLRLSRKAEEVIDLPHGDSSAVAVPPI